MATSCVMPAATCSRFAIPLFSRPWLPTWPTAASAIESSIPRRRPGNTMYSICRGLCGWLWGRRHSGFPIRTSSSSVSITAITGVNASAVSGSIVGRSASRILPISSSSPRVCGRLKASSARCRYLRRFSTSRLRNTTTTRLAIMALPSFTNSASVMWFLPSVRAAPLSFMDIYDKMCFTVSSAGGRRGAQMGTFDVGHPDAMDFVRAKRENGRLRQFNLSLLITDEFMKAVNEGGEWKLAFPISRREYEDEKVDLNDVTKFIWREWPIHEGYVCNDEGLVACRIYKTLPARRMWDVIMSSTYDFAEPGFVLIDRMNEMNNNWWCENIRATNPCGEQGLPPYGACLLGSVNLTRFVREPFTPQARFDWDEYRDVVRVFTRMLDNVVEINGLPLEKQRHEITRKRRHGMGFLGLGSTITLLGAKYGSSESVKFTEDVSREMAIAGWEAALELAREKGPAPIMNEEFTVTKEMLRKRPEMASDGWKPGAKIPGRLLHARYSRYMQRVAEAAPHLVAQLAQIGARFTHHTSIAPTGTISLSLANNASNGIEPSFAHHYFRNVIRPGRKTKEKIDVFSFELLAYRELVNARAMPGSTNEAEALPEYFTAADEVTPHQHVDIQAASQKWIDSSISKTANVPTNFPYEQFKSIYLYAHQQGLKGCTTFRYNPEAFQGVLVKEADLKKTTYVFTLEDGTEINARGDEEIEYDGETHSAANLFDALKEGYYGKF